MLTHDRKHLTLFDDGVEVNRELPKWKNAEKRAPMAVKKVVTLDSGLLNGTSTTYQSTGSPSIVIMPGTYAADDEMLMTPDGRDGSEKKYEVADFDDAVKLEIKDLTAFINRYGVERIYGRNYASNLTWNTGQAIPVPIPGPIETKTEKKKPGNWFDRLFGKKKEGEKKEEVQYEFDAVKFFEAVKLLSKGSMDTYKDRVGKYLSMLHSAKVTGQVAFSEKLAREMFVNKYEAELYANGLYYVVTEDQMVEFANKTEKGIKLMYLKNFTRMLPEDVIAKLEEVNNLEIFDNYVVLTYDPDGTKKGETEEERVKRKDPILFGLLCGSNKLYYITDWVDDYCDLTLQQLADLMEMDKEEFKMK